MDGSLSCLFLWSLGAQDCDSMEFETGFFLGGKVSDDSAFISFLKKTWKLFPSLGAIYFGDSSCLGARHGMQDSVALKDLKEGL